jgi:hypothetical protein
MSVPPADRPEQPGSALPSRRLNPRLKRIRDYERDALNNLDALKANLGAINADLMRVDYRLLNATNAALARSSQPMEDFPALLPALNVISQLTRQIHRLAELDGKLPNGASQEGQTGSSQP